MKVDCAKLVISLDAEIAWGRVSANEISDFFPLFAETKSVIEELIDVFDEYNAPVTWAVVGRLAEATQGSLTKFDKLKTIKLADYFDGAIDESIYADIRLQSKSDSYLRFPELIELITSANVRHDLGSHSYNHCFFQDLKSSKLALLDFKAMEQLGETWGQEINTFVYPKNQVAHLDCAAKCGIKVFRSPDEEWFLDLPKFAHKILRQLDKLLPIAAPVVHAHAADHGLIGIPGSMVFRREHRGIRRHIPISIMSAKANRGMDLAVKNNGVVHLWWHPFNFAYKREQHINALKNVLKHANELREKGKLDIVPMSAFVPHSTAREG